jgi:hypothetical protein
VVAAAAAVKEDETKGKQQGKRDASPAKVGLFASLLRKKETQEKCAEGEEQKKEEVQEGDGANKERRGSLPFPGIPLATDSIEDFTKKQNNQENITEGGDAPAGEAEIEAEAEAEAEAEVEAEVEPEPEADLEGDHKSDEEQIDADAAPTGNDDAVDDEAENEEPAPTADDELAEEKEDAATVTLADLDRKSSAEVIREATERRERRTRARNRRMQGRARAKADAVAKSRPKPNARKTAVDAGRYTQ